ncbi:hypothetical protein XENOCAPTIV_024051, partial [Xenoophorus captivus]
GHVTCFQGANRKLSMRTLKCSQPHEQAFLPADAFWQLGTTTERSPCSEPVLVLELWLDPSLALSSAAHEGPVFSLLSTDCVLLSSGNGEVSSWSWTELTKKGQHEVMNFVSSEREAAVDEEAELQVRMTPPLPVCSEGRPQTHVSVVSLADLVWRSQKSTPWSSTLGVTRTTCTVRHVDVHQQTMRLMMMCCLDSRTGQCVHCIEVYKYEVRADTRPGA